jgi:hypothetical protein
MQRLYEVIFVSALQAENKGITHLGTVSQAILLQAFSLGNQLRITNFKLRGLSSHFQLSTFNYQLFKDGFPMPQE